jgi:ATP-binding cassette, subfamily B (MDR/TAP), member 1
MAQFVMMGMFVQGFWFGAKLVREHGWSWRCHILLLGLFCLIATSNLQMCIPQLIIFATGKFATASLLGVAGDSKPCPAAAPWPPQSTLSPFHLKSSS